MLILGVFVGVLAGIVFMKAFSAGTGAERFDDPDLIGDPDVGVRPVVHTVADSVSAPMSGPQVYNENCYLCHAAPGVGGAPVFGDTQAWAPRIAQGQETLSERVINGYQGELGVMPPKGGRTDLSDEEILEALAFMLDEVQP